MEQNGSTDETCLIQFGCREDERRTGKVSLNLEMSEGVFKFEEVSSMYLGEISIGKSP